LNNDTSSQKNKREGGEEANESNGDCNCPEETKLKREPLLLLHKVQFFKVKKREEEREREGKQVKTKSSG